jgi:hypothetical protein
MVINLLIDAINKKLDQLNTYGKYQLQHVQYDTGVVALGNPSTSSLGAHPHDGKPGIVCFQPHTWFQPFYVDGTNNGLPEPLCSDGKHILVSVRLSQKRGAGILL